jgi:hypothetical protein
MNEMDLLTRFRAEVPYGVSPHTEDLFRIALQQELSSERSVVSPPRPLARISYGWRLTVVVSAAAALVAGIVVAVLPSSPVVLTAQLLADRASAAALTQPTVSPGQWVYRVVESNNPGHPKGVPSISTEAGWETADGQVTYGDNFSLGVDTGDNIPSYSQLGSLPRDPAALNAYLVRLVYSGSSKPFQKDLAAFSVTKDMLMNYVLPPALEAEVFQALAIIPTVKVDSHVTAIDGRAGVAFELPETPQSDSQEIILDASTYSFLGQASWFSKSLFNELAIKQMVIVGAPGSTQPSLTPPTAAELLAEQADRAVTFTNAPPLFAEPGTWIFRELATSSGDQEVWATADDSEQASYINGKLQICSRSAACAASTQWLMPAGPSYTLVNPSFPQGRPPFKQLPPSLPSTLAALLAKLNTYRTGCTDVTGECNAVNVLASIMAGYANRGGPEPDWFLVLANVPGVTVQRLTDVTGQADVAFRFPFTDGVTEILLSASTHELAGYVRDGGETVITKEVAVSGPGSRTPAVIHPKRIQLRP